MTGPSGPDLHANQVSFSGHSGSWIRRFAGIDAWLMTCRPATRLIVMAIVVAGLTAMCVSYIPRAYLSFAGIPLLERIDQPEEYGTDTIADMYEAKVVLHDWRDMYTKTGVPQTPLEARTWTREASAPYPPVALFVEAAIYWTGEKTGVGFYGLMLGLAAIFVVQAALYCLATRWYVFPLLGVSGLYFGYRFTYVQDCTYLILLVLVMAALELAKRRGSGAHLLMAFAIAVKVSPFYYAMNLPRMRPWTATAFVAVLIAAFILPYFVLDNYLYIFTFQNAVKGGGWRMVGALVVSVPFAILLAYVSVRRNFDLEDRIGWGVLPLAILLAFNLNVARHVLVVLLVPDKRARRTAAAATAMAVYYLSFGLLRLNSTLPISVALLYAILVYELRQVSRSQVQSDLQNPMRTLRMILTQRAYVQRPT